MTLLAEARTCRAMTRKTEQKPRAAETAEEREKRLADALRANLRRRKTAKKPDKDAGQP
ncbi:MAG: hypothetical protein ACOC05_11890 [Oceanicaulis sp.]